MALNKGLERVDAVNDEVAKVVKCAAVWVPDIKLMDQDDYLTIYGRFMRKAELEQLSSCCAAALQFVSGTIGGLTGQMAGNLNELTVGTFINFMRHGRSLMEIGDSVRNRRKVEFDGLLKVKK